MKKLLIASAFTAVFCVACNRTQPEGPAERAGRHVDNASDKIHDDAVRTGENAKEIGRDVKQRLDPNQTALENRR